MFQSGWALCCCFGGASVSCVCLIPSHFTTVDIFRFSFDDQVIDRTRHSHHTYLSWCSFRPFSSPLANSPTGVVRSSISPIPCILYCYDWCGLVPVSDIQISVHNICREVAPLPLVVDTSLVLRMQVLVRERSYKMDAPVHDSFAYHYLPRNHVTRILWKT